jgi:hypothetical protein
VQVHLLALGYGNGGVREAGGNLPDSRNMAVSESARSTDTIPLRQSTVNDKWVEQRHAERVRGAIERFEVDLAQVIAGA